MSSPASIDLRMADDRKQVTRLLRQAVIELCRARLSGDRGLEIDGILCVTVGDDCEENQVVIKVHEKISPTPRAESYIACLDVNSDDDQSWECTFTPVQSPENDIGDEAGYDDDGDGGGGGDDVVGDDYDYDDGGGESDHASVVTSNATSIKQEIGDQSRHHSMHLRKHSLKHPKEAPFDDDHDSDSKGLDAIIVKTEMRTNDLSVMETNDALHVKGLRFACDVCDKAFSQKSALIRHSRTHTGERPFECSECELKFGDVTTLRRHLAQIHNVPPGSRMKTEPFPCDICGKELRTKYSRKLHVRAVHQGITKLPKKCLCTLCGKICRNVTVLKEHQNKYHLHVSPFPCKTCGRRFHAKGLLRAHENQTHSDVRRYACEVCGKAFKRHNAMKEHVMTHTTIRPNECDICQKRFLQKAGLVRHYRTHTGLRPFLCKICHGCFADASTLRRHVIAVHNVPRDKWNKDEFEAIAQRPDHPTVLPRGRRKRQGKDIKTEETSCGQDEMGETIAVSIHQAGPILSADHTLDASDSAAADNMAVASVLIPETTTNASVRFEIRDDCTAIENADITAVVAAASGTFESNESVGMTHDYQTDENAVALGEDKGGSLIIWDNEVMSLSEEVYIIMDEQVVQLEEMVTTETA